jgi:hypothetical protein
MLDLATSTSHSLLQSRAPLGRARFLRGSVGKGVITANLVKKEAAITCVLGYARRFDAGGAANGWHADRRDAGPESPAGAAVG